MQAERRDNILVSIIVRTLGRRKNLLTLALDSLAAQSHKNLEVIVVEDGGDGLSNLVKAANKKYGEIFVHKPIEKAGRGVAGNVGLAIAKGEFLGFLDEDDELYPNHIETLLSVMSENPDFHLVYGRAHKLYCDGLEEDRPRIVRRGQDEWLSPFSRTKLWLRNRFPIQAALFNRTLYKEHGGFDPSLHLLEDWDLWIRYSYSRDFLEVNSYTSFYRMPADLSNIKDRESSHNKWRDYLYKKHRNISGSHKFEDIIALPDETVRDLPFRKAMAAAISALRLRVKSIGQRDA